MNANWNVSDESQCQIRKWEIMKNNIEEIIDDMWEHIWGKVPIGN